MPGLTSTSAENGEEVLATYGAHSNDKLMVHYGFIHALTMQHASPDDEVRLDHVIIPHLSEETKSQLQDVGFLGGYALLPSEYPCKREPKDDDPWRIRCSENCRQPWEPCFKTQVAVRAVLLTANEWQYFVTNGEDLSGDQSAAVNKWLQPHLQDLRAEALQKQADLQKLRDGGEGPLSEDRAVGIRMLHDRWSQISKHLDNFLNNI
jgi:hypothetical protein